MSTSPRVGRRRFPASMCDAAGVVTAQRVYGQIANNALHYADTKCHHWVNWISPRASHVAGGNPVYRTPSPVSASWVRTAFWGPFRITRRGDGTPYVVRAEILASSSGAGVSCEFALLLMPSVPSGVAAIEDPSFVGGRGVIFAPTTSTTAAWLAAASGSKAFTPSYELGREMRSRSTLVDTAGAPTTVGYPEIYVVAFTKSANIATATPRIHGVHVSEYVGA